MGLTECGTGPSHVIEEPKTQTNKQQFNPKISFPYYSLSILALPFLILILFLFLILFYLNKADTDFLAWMLKMAWARRGATDSSVSFSLAALWGVVGMVFKITTSSILDLEILSLPGPLKSPWDANANTLLIKFEIEIEI